MLNLVLQITDRHRNRKIDLAFQGSINDETNPALKNNDVIVVNRSGLAKFRDTTGSIFAPVTGIFSFLRILPGI